MAWRRCEKCGYAFVTGINDEKCPHIPQLAKLPAAEVQSVDAGPEDFPRKGARETPIENLRRLNIEQRKRHLLASLTEMIGGAANFTSRFERPPIEDGIDANGDELLKPGPKVYITIELDV